MSDSRPSKIARTPRRQIASVRDALQLAIDWHASTPDFVAKYGHGASGREMVAVLREAAMVIDGETGRPCEVEDGKPGTYCGWDRQWLCTDHARTDRHWQHPGLTLSVNE